MTEQTSYTFEDCIKKCESIIDGIYQDGYQSIYLYSLKTFISGIVNIHNKTTIELQDEVNQFRVIGTIEEFQALKEKNKPKKPVEQIKLIGLDKGGKCPTCQRYINNNQYWMYCECGQRIDWK